MFKLTDLCFEPSGRLVTDHVTLDIPAGSCFCFVGPSGCGKSSLIRLLNRLNVKTSGEVLFDGKPIESYDVRVLRRQVAMVFQKTCVFEGTVRDNLMLALELADEIDDPTIETRLAECLSAAGLPESALSVNAELMSGGEQQRLGIARALLTRPKVLLLDEPTASLDVEATQIVMQTIKSLRSDRTIVMVNHHLEEVEDVATHVAMVDKGRIVEVADVDSFFNNPRTERVKAFLAAYRRYGDKV